MINTFFRDKTFDQNMTKGLTTQGCFAEAGEKKVTVDKTGECKRMN